MIYVDDSRLPYGRMFMSHMIADNTAELLSMVDRIAVDRRYIQYPGTYREHFDICSAKRRKAVMLGAVAVTSRELVQHMRTKRIVVR